MIKEKLNTYFSDRGFSRVDLHMESSDLYYLSEDKAASLVWIVASEFAEGLNADTYNEYYKKIVGTFFGNGFTTVNTLTLFLSNDPKACLSIAGETAFWVVDEGYGRVVVYENQPEDYLGIRLPVEKMVSMMLESTLREAERDARVAEENAAREAHYENIKKAKGRGRGLRAINRKPYMCYALVIINFLVFIFTDLLGSVLGTDSWLSLGENAWYLTFDQHEYYRAFTCMFLHWSVDHVFGNMLCLFAAGVILEQILGHWRFLCLYLVSGVAASFGSAFYYYKQGAYSPSAGASGAVYAIIGALIIHFIIHKEQLRLLGSGQILLFILYLGYTLILGFRPENNVDNAAHICGLLAGGLMYLIFYLIATAKRRR